LNQLKHQGFFYGAILYVFAIPFPAIFINGALVIWTLLSLLCFDKVSLNKNKLLWVFPALYLLYFLGHFTSENATLKFMEYKLSLLLFPFLFFLNSYDKEKRITMIRALTFGLIFAGLICLINSLYNSISIVDGEVSFQPNVLKGREFVESILYGGNFFFGKHFSIFHQTVYFAIYLSFGVAALLFQPNLFKKPIRIVVLIFFLLLLFLISNKASFIAITIIFLVWIVKAKFEFIKKATIGGVILIAIVTLITVNPRTKESVKKIFNGGLELNKNARYGFGTRLLTWDAAISLIKEQPVFGYGIDETQFKLNETYTQKEYREPLKQSLNAHNLWLQTWLENGIVPVILFFLIFTILFYKVFKSYPDNGFVLSLISILLINSIFESVFSRFSGLSFFTFALCFLLTYPELTKKESI